MFRKIVVSIGVIAVFAIAGAYFYFAGELSAKGRSGILCNSVDVVILDSLQNKMLEKKEVVEMVLKGGKLLGQRIDTINTHNIEKNLLDEGEISEAEVYTLRDGTLRVEISQRKPAIRFENNSQRHYADETGYIFPLLSTSTVPIVSGEIPLSLSNDFKGYPVEKDLKWIKSALALTSFIENNSYWKRQVEQISVQKNGDIILSLRCGSERIIFGKCTDIEEKFEKLAAYYKSVAPQNGVRRYKTVNLKYKNQIICK